MAVGRLVEAQQFFAQAFPGDAEQFRRPALVALAGVEGPLYQQALRLFQIKRMSGMFFDFKRCGNLVP